MEQERKTMRDYEELVQELRTFIYVPAVLQAADAIEELWQCAHYYKDLADNRQMTIQKILEAETKQMPLSEPPKEDDK